MKTLTEAKKKTRSAWIAALYVAGMALAFAIFNTTDRITLSYIVSHILEFRHVIISLVLAFGIIRYSRWCAVFMFTYYFGDKVLAFFFVQPSIDWIEIIISYYLFQGILGTFAYHRLRRQPVEMPASKSEETIV
jgi:membrane-associated HD superfamily phosphohydrolase